MLLALEHLQWGFCVVLVHFLCVSSFVDVLHFVVVVFHSFPGYFIMSPALHPGFSGTWRSPPVLSSTLSTFDCLFFLIYRKCYGFEWAFFTRRRFLPYAPSWHFWHNLLLSRPPWKLAVLPWSLKGFILIFKTQTRPICFFENQTNRWAGSVFWRSTIFIHLKLVFIHVNIAKVFTCSENFDKK